MIPFTVFSTQKMRDLSYDFWQVLIQWHILSFHSLSDELEVTFLSLIVRLSYFYIFGEAFLNHVLLIFKIMSPKQLYPPVITFQYFSPHSIYLDSLHSTHVFLNTPIIETKRIISYCAKTAI